MTMGGVLNNVSGKLFCVNKNTTVHIYTCTSGPDIVAYIKLSFSATDTQGEFGKKKNAFTENNLYVSMVEVEVEVPWFCGAVFHPKALGTL